MATFQIAPPDKLSLKNPDEWPKLLCRFECFYLASGISEQSEEMQVNALIYAMGMMLMMS